MDCLFLGPVDHAGHHRSGKTGHADDYQCRGHKNQMGMAWEDAKSVLDHHPSSGVPASTPRPMKLNPLTLRRRPPSPKVIIGIKGQWSWAVYAFHDVALACPRARALSTNPFSLTEITVLRMTLAYFDQPTMDNANIRFGTPGPGFRPAPGEDDVREDELEVDDPADQPVGSASEVSGHHPQSSAQCHPYQEDHSSDEEREPQPNTSMLKRHRPCNRFQEDAQASRERSCFSDLSLRDHEGRSVVQKEL